MREKRAANAAIFYYQEFGYIIGSRTEYLVSEHPTIVNPVMTLRKGENYGMLGELVVKALDISSAAPQVEQVRDKPYKYWQVSKIGSFSAFSKKFQKISIERREEGYLLMQSELASYGGYFASKTKKPFFIPLTTTPEELGNIIQQTFCEGNPAKEGREGSFVTLHDTLVEYQKPSDDFEDAGDGGTDAYQIFVYEENSRNYIAFLMDHQYTAIHKSVIQKRWEKMFGNLLEFQFRETQNGILKFKARGKTNVSQIESYLFQDGDTFMEVMTEIDILNTSVKEQKEIAAELNQTINSITMKQEG